MVRMICGGICVKDISFFFTLIRSISGKHPNSKKWVGGERMGQYDEIGGGDKSGISSLRFPFSSQKCNQLAYFRSSTTS